MSQDHAIKLYRGIKMVKMVPMRGSKKEVTRAALEMARRGKYSAAVIGDHVIEICRGAAALTRVNY